MLGGKQICNEDRPLFISLIERRPPNLSRRFGGFCFVPKGGTPFFNRRLFFIPLLASRSGSYRIASSVIPAGVIFPCKGKAACPVAKYRCANGLRSLTATFPNQRLTFSPPSLAGQGQTGCCSSCSSSGMGIPFSPPAVYLSYPSFVRC